jgi:hypothetical protein
LPVLVEVAKKSWFFAVRLALPLALVGEVMVSVGTRRVEDEGDMRCDGWGKKVDASGATSNSLRRRGGRSGCCKLQKRVT